MSKSQIFDDDHLSSSKISTQDIKNRSEISEDNKSLSDSRSTFSKKYELVNKSDQKVDFIRKRGLICKNVQKSIISGTSNRNPLDSKYHDTNYFSENQTENSLKNDQKLFDSQLIYNQEVDGLSLNKQACYVTTKKHDGQNQNFERAKKLDKCDRTSMVQLKDLKLAQTNSYADTPDLNEKRSKVTINQHGQEEQFSVLSESNYNNIFNASRLDDSSFTNKFNSKKLNDSSYENAFNTSKLDSSCFKGPKLLQANTLTEQNKNEPKIEIMEIRSNSKNEPKKNFDKKKNANILEVQSESIIPGRQSAKSVDNQMKVNIKKISESRCSTKELFSSTKSNEEIETFNNEFKAYAESLRISNENSLKSKAANTSNDRRQRCKSDFLTDQRESDRSLKTNEYKIDFNAKEDIHSGRSLNVKEVDLIKECKKILDDYIKKYSSKGELLNNFFLFFKEKIEKKRENNPQKDVVSEILGHISHVLKEMFKILENGQKTANKSVKNLQLILENKHYQNNCNSSPTNNTSTNDLKKFYETKSQEYCEFFHDLANLFYEKKLVNNKHDIILTENQFDLNQLKDIIKGLLENIRTPQKDIKNLHNNSGYKNCPKAERMPLLDSKIKLEREKETLEKKLLDLQNENKKYCAENEYLQQKNKAFDEKNQLLEKENSEFSNKIKLLKKNIKEFTKNGLPRGLDLSPDLSPSITYKANKKTTIPTLRLDNLSRPEISHLQIEK